MQELTQQQAVETISNNLDKARMLIEEALTLGREHAVHVDVNKIGLGGDDMWYVSEDDWYREQLEEIDYEFEEGSEEYEEAVAELNERLERVKENSGYDNDYKVTGWMSSSTNC